MSRRKQTIPFPSEPGSPAPLFASAARRARFEEVDALGIVWHGRYPSYFEDARVAFGEKYGLKYLDMFRNGFIAPIVQMHIDYHSPLQLDDPFTVSVWMHWTDSVRLNSRYEITGEEGLLVASGWTVQMLMNLEREVLVAWPEYMEEFRRRWKEGKFANSDQAE